MTKKLSDLEVGDEVVVVGGYSRAPEIRKIDRITKTLIIVGDGRYNRQDGHAPGPIGHHTARITVPSDFDRNIIDLNISKAKLRELIYGIEVKIKDMDIETMEKIITALKEVLCIS